MRAVHFPQVLVFLRMGSSAAGPAAPHIFPPRVITMAFVSNAFLTLRPYI